MTSRRKKMEHTMKMMQGLHITSKASLKQFCLLSTQCDVDRAEKMYDFLAKDMEGLPTFDPVPPGWVERTRNAVGGIFGFVKDNRDDIVQAVDLVRAMAGKGAMPAAAPAPVEPLPPIN